MSTMKYAKLDLGTIEAVVNKLGGMEGVERFLRGETIVKVPNASDLSVWKTVKLGTGLKDSEAFRQALKKVGHRIDDWGNDILGQPAFETSIAKEATEVELVVVSAAELGFKDGASFADICQRGIERGLMLCPAEVGPQLCLQYKDQPKGEWLLIAMEAIAASGGFLKKVFFVKRCDDGEQWLHGYYGSAGHFWFGNDRFVFLRRK